jgi:hypothetical protein
LVSLIRPRYAAFFLSWPAPRDSVSALVSLAVICDHR